MRFSEMSFFRNLPERKILNSKPDLLELFLFKFSLCWKTFASESDYFFLKVSFQTLIFNEKICYKVMPFKTSTQSEKLVVGRGANRVKTLFLRRDVFIEIWFLDINWTENLIFRKIFVSTKRFFEKFFIEIRQDKKLSILKLIKLLEKNFTSKSDISFKKFHFKFLIFKEKVYFKIMPFKISTKSENYVVFPGTNWVKTFFFGCEFFIEIWFLIKNWTQKLSFW